MTVDDYINDAPADLQPTLRYLRAKITRAIPGAAETVERFPVYTINDTWTAGFAHRAKGVMLYIMAPGVLDAHEQTLGPLRTGRSCVAWKPGHLTIQQLDDLADTMLADAAAAMK